MKKHLFTVAIILVSVIGAHAQKAEVYAPKGNAINGYDPVAFFTMSKPVMGADDYTCMYKDVKWKFSSKENRDAFQANPEHYAPQYGGYCAYGTAEGHKAPTEIETWSVVNDKLYFNYNGKVKEMWVKDQQSYIMKADKKWPEIKGGK
jgi:YHS domain-containing protein